MDADLRMKCTFRETAETDRGQSVWRCVYCNAKAYGGPSKRTCDREPRPASLVEVDCKFLTGTWCEEVVVGCCDGQPVMTDIGNCALFGRIEGVSRCVGCEKKEPKE